jgi:nitroreductase
VRISGLIAAMTLAALLAPLAAFAAEPAPMTLPAPRKTGGKPLMEALALRSTARAFAPDPLPEQTLSDLLWAAWGINRPDGKRTAPSAVNWQEIDLYAVLDKGAFRYDPAKHSLEPVAAGDLRALTGKQGFVKDAPLTLVMVADYSRMGGNWSDTDKDAFASADAAFISQNIYLYCASEGLATGVRALVDKPALGAALKLTANRKVVFAQTVGYPKK